MLLRKGLNTWRSTTAVVSCCLVFCLQECEFWMSQSCLCSRLMFCYMKCYHFPVFPHTASVSLTAGVHVLSYLLFFSLEILLCDIASAWYRSYFVSLFQNWAQRTCARAFRSSMPTFISRLQISYRLVEKKLQISRHSKMGMAVWT